MRKPLLLILILTLIPVLVFCQFEEKMKEENVVRGTIMIKGERIEGYIKKIGLAIDEDMYPAPWQFQTKIRFIKKEVFEKSKKIKRKYYEKYKPKKCDGYEYESLIFVSVKYADMTALGMNMIPKKIFMRKISDNKISIYHHFSSPLSVSVSGGLAEDYIECAKPNIVYQKGEKGKLKLVNSLNVSKVMADCPKVIEKYNKGGYKIMGNKKESTRLGKLANNTIFRTEVRLNAIEDYNKICK